MNKKFIPITMVALILVLLIFSGQIITLYTDWLWFKGIDLEVIFLKILTAKLTFGVIFGIVFFGLMSINFFFAKRLAPKTVYYPEKNLLENFNIDIFASYAKYSNLLVLGIIFMSILVAAGAASNWDMFLRYFNFVPFGDVEPVFERDIGFYVFKLPVLKYVYHWLIFVLVLSIMLAVFVYVFNRSIHITSQKVMFSKAAKIHLFILVALILLLKSYGYRLQAYGMLSSHGGVVFGATYTDLHARLPVLNILAVISFICALLFLSNIFIKNWKLPIAGIGVLIIVSFLGGTVYPGLMQKFQVVPNEIVMETPYIKRNIQYTRKAYNLEDVEVKEFPASGDLTLTQLQKNTSTIDNIRLWDHRPLLATYQQLQGIRTYYKFVDVDVDRYTVDGKYRQVMLSARELDYESLPSKIWINERLSFTHGYGICMSPVNTFTSEGMPEFFIKDIPPVDSPGFEIDRAEIYYGEIPNDYVIVKTESKEFDYPSGEENIYSSYKGDGGVEISSILRRWAFALRFSSLKILLNTDITGESRIMYYRRIKERLEKICPFMEFETDPYIVISEGKLYWICDGYTITNLYPYSQPVTGKINYIRNSVKAVVNAYSGNVSFYISDENDPLIMTYSRIFPGVFMPLEQMPSDLKMHIRYPEEFFKIQSAIYGIYHMEDPQIFYNKEDVWNIPNEIFERDEQPMEPYYIIMRLPGESKEEFILMQPFTPMNKNNLSAWLCAKCDQPNYGKLLVFKFPKKELIYGPMQIEARIDQDAEISQQLSLWGQIGSDVIRGNLLVIPIENSLLYIEPLYLKAERGELPELKRIIVAFGNRIAMEKDLYSALRKVFGGAPASASVAQRLGKGVVSISELADEALKHFRRARDSHHQDDWAGFGEELKKVGELLEKLNKSTRER